LSDQLLEQIVHILFRDLIRLSCSSKTHEIQVNLFGSELKPNQWKVLGFICASLLDFDVEIWTFELTHEDMQKVFSVWDKVNHVDQYFFLDRSVVKKV
jgi:hypothetical protein